MMFRTLSNNADPGDCSDEVEKNASKESGADSRSTASTVSDVDAIERGPEPDEVEEYGDEKRPVTPSSQIKETASNALSLVASRLTTKSLTDPGPAPDGGLMAWSQVALGWLAIATTWGWINCFGQSSNLFCHDGLYLTRVPCYRRLPDLLYPPPRCVAIDHFLDRNSPKLPVLLPWRILRPPHGRWVLPSHRYRRCHTSSTGDLPDEHQYAILALRPHPRSSQRSRQRYLFHTYDGRSGAVVHSQAIDCAGSCLHREFGRIDDISHHCSEIIATTWLPLDCSRARLP